MPCRSTSDRPQRDPARIRRGVLPVRCHPRTSRWRSTSVAARAERQPVPRRRRTSRSRKLLIPSRPSTLTDAHARPSGLRQIRPVVVSFAVDAPTATKPSRQDAVVDVGAARGLERRRIPAVHQLGPCLRRAAERSAPYPANDWATLRTQAAVAMRPRGCATPVTRRCRARSRRPLAAATIEKSRPRVCVASRTSGERRRSSGSTEIGRRDRVRAPLESRTPASSSEIAMLALRSGRARSSSRRALNSRDFTVLFGIPERMRDLRDRPLFLHVVKHEDRPCRSTGMLPECPAETHRARRSRHRATP